MADGPAKKPQPPTEYMILSRHEGEGGNSPSPVFWVEQGVYEGRSAEDAIKACAVIDREKDQWQPGTFKAVPVRSWKHGLSIQTEEKVVVATSFHKLNGDGDAKTIEEHAEALSEPVPDEAEAASS